MLDLIFSVGQAMSALLLLYGAVLVAGQLLPAKKPVSAKPQGAPLLVKHVGTDA